MIKIVLSFILGFIFGALLLIHIEVRHEEDLRNAVLPSQHAICVKDAIMQDDRLRAAFVFIIQQGEIICAASGES